MYGLTLLQEDCVMIESDDIDLVQSRVDPAQSRITLSLSTNKQGIWLPRNPNNDLWNKENKTFQVKLISIDESTFG